MEYLKFEVRNFKGIEYAEIHLNKEPKGSVYTLVGLNESGKTTILEAISFFNRSDKSLESLYKEELRHGDVNDLVPLKKKANFNGEIVIEATLSLNETDKKSIINFARKSQGIKLDLDRLNNSFSVKQKLFFENSVYKESLSTWIIGLHGKKNRERKSRDIYDHDKAAWLEIIGFIRKKFPPILYFPTFLFEFPSRVYLEKNDDESETNEYYRDIVQDILDSLDDGLTVDEHIVSRAIEGGRVQKRSLDTVLNKMGNIVSKTIYERWNDIFDKKIPKKDIVIACDIDDQGKVFLEFEIRDGDSIYLITERSLGFRWFFCFLLFTQFRAYRKTQESALFLFDEPASNLHSRAQRQLLNSFSKITEKAGKIIYSTHSHYMINPQWLENTFIVRNDGLKYDDDEGDYEYSCRETNVCLDSYREFVSKHPDKETYFQPILDTLDYVPSDLERVSSAILVEGKNDFYFIKYFEKILFGKVPSLSVIPGVGSGGLDTIISLYLGWGKSFVILLDDDSAGKKEKSRYIKEWLLDESQVVTYKDLCPDWAGYKAEFLIDKTDKEILVGSSEEKGGKVSKKVLCRSIQEKLINDEMLGFSQITLDNFTMLISLLKKKLDSL